MSLVNIPSAIFESSDYVLIGDSNHTDINPRLRLAKFVSIASRASSGFDCLFLEDSSDLNPSIAEYLNSSNPTMDIILDAQRDWNEKLNNLKGISHNGRPPGARSSLKFPVLESARLNKIKVYGIDIDLESSDRPIFLAALRLLQSGDSGTSMEGFRYILEGRTKVFAKKIEKYKVEGKCHRSIVFVGSAHLKSEFEFSGENMTVIPLGVLLDNGNAKFTSIELVD